MSDYIVSARKYRPDSFESLIGQDNIAQTLKNSILRGQLAHAYLFCGPRGVGKTSAARIFAKTINCSSPTADMEPCGECESCTSFKEGRSYCIHELDAASNNGVEDIKALMDQVQIPPQVGRYSVYIIDEVHMLSQSAFNAFLKTLEEPPAHAIFILCTTEKHKIIPTILSRCQTYDFNRIGVPDIVRNLRSIAERENISIDDESLHVIAKKADGAMRDALTIFDQTVAFCGTDIHVADVIRNLNVLDSDYGFKLVDAFLARDYATALLVFNEILEKGFNAQHFISALGSHLRDLLVARTGGLESLLDLPDSLKASYRKQAQGCSVKFLFDALGIISQCEAGYRSATNQRLHIEFALMKLAFLGGVPDSKVTVAASPEVPAVSARPVSAAPAEKTAPAPAAPAALAKPSPVEKPAPAPEPAPEAPAAPAAAPKPAPEPAAAAPAGEPEAIKLILPSDDEFELQPRPAKRSRGAAALSLSSIMDDTDDAIEGTAIFVENKNESTGLIQLPDDDSIRAKWQELVPGISQQRLAFAVKNAKLEIKETDGMKIVTFFVVNESQKKWIEEKAQRDLEGKLRSLLGTEAIRLEIAVVPEEEQPEKIYMPSEKARDLMEKNEEVRELVAELGLDVK
ncbi:MAG: DNA polymerase III subunit gamma/tau [Bacteroidales bacterium]|nr:DNA polymerase III subunit gamma/tau [Bacteroidales bacterium]